MANEEGHMVRAKSMIKHEIIEIGTSDHESADEKQNFRDKSPMTPSTELTI